jgi:hypothetical protein
MAFENCSCCGREIEDGETYWSVSVNQEVFDGEAIEVLDSSMLLVYCQSCASARDFEKTTVPPRA